jgi:hypothetical protein
MKLRFVRFALVALALTVTLYRVVELGRGRRPTSNVAPISMTRKQWQITAHNSTGSVKDVRRPTQRATELKFGEVG